MSSKSSPKNHWFKRRRYGYGWIPITWQGWLVVALFISIIITAAFQLPPKPGQPTPEEVLQFVVTFAAALIVLLGISFIKGPKPKWRWGKKPTDNPHEDY